MDWYWLDTDLGTGWLKEHISYFCRYRSVEAPKPNQNQIARPVMQNGTRCFWAPTDGSEGKVCCFLPHAIGRGDYSLTSLLVIAAEYISN